MKWLGFVLTLLGLCAFSHRSLAKEARTLTLSESDIAPVKTALGYTTMLNFASRPSSVILGDQDAFKVEYIGNGLAIKPLFARGKTNLFVFTDYDRFSFRLTVGAPTEADYSIRIKNKQSGPYPVETEAPVTAPAQKSSPLIERKINRRKVCGGFQLAVESVSWPKSESTYLVLFRVSEMRSSPNTLSFEPGDFDVVQGKKSLPIENLYLERLFFSAQGKSIRGTLVLRQSEIERSMPLVLTFAPDFLKRANRCLAVSFSRRTSAKKKS